MKYRLLKDTPEFRAGTVFTPLMGTWWEGHPGIKRFTVVNPEDKKDPAEANGYSLTTILMGIGEWFEEVKDGEGT